LLQAYPQIDHTAVASVRVDRGRNELTKGVTQAAPKKYALPTQEYPFELPVFPSASTILGNAVLTILYLQSLCGKCRSRMMATPHV